MGADRDARGRFLPGRPGGPGAPAAASRPTPWRPSPRPCRRRSGETSSPPPSIRPATGTLFEPFLNVPVAATPRCTTDRWPGSMLPPPWSACRSRPSGTALPWTDTGAPSSPVCPSPGDSVGRIGPNGTRPPACRGISRNTWRTAKPSRRSAPFDLCNRLTGGYAARETTCHDASLRTGVAAPRS
jgi:hypothetical protein